MEVVNSYVTIKTHIDGSPKESDFELKKSVLDLSVESGSGDLIIKNLYVSIDPYQLNRMKSSSPSQHGNSFSVGLVPGEVSDAIHIYIIICIGHTQSKTLFPKSETTCFVFTGGRCVRCWKSVSFWKSRV